MAFFFSPSRDALPKNTALDLLRSLLCQLFLIPSFQHDAFKFMRDHQSKLLQGQKATWHPSEFSKVIVDIFRAHRLVRPIDVLRKRRLDETMIFIDALNECGEYRLALQPFLQDLVSHTHGSTLKICISDQDVPLGMRSSCQALAIDHHNHGDIMLYVQKRLRVGNLLEIDQLNHLKSTIIDRAQGVFLWVMLVVDLLQQSLDEARDFQFLCGVLQDIPTELKELYRSLIIRSADHSDPENDYILARVMQWILFSARSLDVREWHHVLAFCQYPTLKSIAEWRLTKAYTENDHLLMQRLKHICRGLVDVKDRHISRVPDSTRSEDGSLGVGAGSFESLQYVDVIHSSVRTFFMEENGGFALLDPRISKPRGEGHLRILEICARYWFLNEMKDAFWTEAAVQKVPDVPRPIKLQSTSPPPDYESFYNSTYNSKRRGSYSGGMSLGSSAGSAHSSHSGIVSFGLAGQPVPMLYPRQQIDTARPNSEETIENKAKAIGRKELNRTACVNSSSRRNFLLKGVKWLISTLDCERMSINEKRADKRPPMQLL